MFKRLLTVVQLWETDVTGVAVKILDIDYIISIEYVDYQQLEVRFIYSYSCTTEMKIYLPKFEIVYQIFSFISLFTTAYWVSPACDWSSG